MKLLVVTNLFPYPPTMGSSILCYNHIKELSRQNDINLVCLDSPRSLGEFSNFVTHVDFVKRKNRSYLVKRLVYFFYSVCKGVPITFSANASPSMARIIKELVAKGEFDAILCYGMSSIQHVPSSLYKKVIVLVEDPESLKIERMKKLPVFSILKKLLLFFEKRMFERMEKALLPKVGKAVFLSKADVNDMVLSDKKNIGIVPYGIDAKEIFEDNGFQNRTEGVIVLSGNMFHLPNVDGALFFINEIFPIVLKGYPGAKLWIVGSNPDERILKCASKHNGQVVVTGKVDDVSLYIRRAKVCICPVRLKIGVQTKVLEALSWGTPVVTTSAGNSGIEGKAGITLMVDDQAQQFANSVIDLLNGVNWDTLSKEGKLFVETKFSWNKSAAELQKHINVIVKGNVAII